MQIGIVSTVLTPFIRNSESTFVTSGLEKKFLEDEFGTLFNVYDRLCFGPMSQKRS